MRKFELICRTHPPEIPLHIKKGVFVYDFSNEILNIGAIIDNLIIMPEMGREKRFLLTPGIATRLVSRKKAPIIIELSTENGVNHANSDSYSISEGETCLSISSKILQIPVEKMTFFDYFHYLQEKSIIKATILLSHTSEPVAKLIHTAYTYTDVLKFLTKIKNSARNS